MEAVTKESSTESSGTVRSDLWELYAHRYEYSPLPLVATEGKLHIVRYANPAFCALVGLKSAQILDLPFSVAVPERAGNDCLALLDRVYASGVTENISEQPHSHDIEVAQHWSYSVWAVLEEDQCPPGLMIQVADITDTVNMRAEATAISEALTLFCVKQHEFAELAESAHKHLEDTLRKNKHQTINNLLALSSLLNMQLKSNPQNISILELAKIQMHIKTITAMQLFFGEMGKGQAASAKEMLQKLMPMWKEIVGKANIQWSADELLMPEKKATSLLTIIHELVCNAIKHGAKSVILQLKGVGETVMLEVLDDGPGFAKDFSLSTSKRFGLKFVEYVTSSELRGKATFSNRPEGGACVNITFPVTAGVL